MDKKIVASQLLKLAKELSAKKSSLPNLMETLNAIEKINEEISDFDNYLSEYKEDIMEEYEAEGGFVSRLQKNTAKMLKDFKTFEDSFNAVKKMINKVKTAKSLTAFTTEAIETYHELKRKGKSPQDAADAAIEILSNQMSVSLSREKADALAKDLLKKADPNAYHQLYN